MKISNIKRYFGAVSLSAMVFGFAGGMVFGQKTEATPTDDVSGKARNVKKEMNEAYKRWINTDVDYIITKEERRAFNALQTDEERENFIANFWNRRDPNPDTEENEYREQYYERIAYANEHFASGIPGWKTDRGRIYITWGKPDSVESHPTGGAYDRPSWEGGGNTSTYPFEIWFYRHLDNVGEGLEIEFVDPTSTGEYRLARNANEKDALLMVPGGGMTTAEQLGLENRSDRIGNFGDGKGYMREQDSPFRRLEIMTAMSRAPGIQYGDLTGLAGGDSGSILAQDPLPFDVRVDFFRQSDENVITTFTIQASNKDLSFEDEGGLGTAKMNIRGQITSVAGKRSAAFQDSVTTNATAAELINAKDRKSVYQTALAMKPGDYKVDVRVTDVNTGKIGIVNLGFKVPRYDDKKLSTSSLILASTLRSTDERDIGQAFVIGSTKVIPNLEGVYKKGQDVGVYLQVYNAQIDQTTLRPAVDVEYVLSKDGKEVFRQPEDWSGLSDSGQRLTLARLLPTEAMPVGNYEIKIVTKDRVGDGQTVENKGKFTITD